MNQFRTPVAFPETPDSQRPRASFCRSGIFLLLFLGLSAGCGKPLLKVTRAKPPAPPIQDAELPGIPFFAVGYRCLHTSVWLEPVYAVTLVVSSDDKSAVPVAITQTKIFGRQELYAPCSPTSPCASATLARIQNNPKTTSYQPFLDEFRNLPEMDPLTFDTTKILVPNSPESKEVVLSSNAVAPERYVDASTVYYYNLSKPWSGTANGEVDLTDEGILSKASGQVESKTLETILGVFPISDLIKAAAGVKIAAAPTGPYRLDLQVQSRVYKHTRSAVVSGAAPPCSPLATLVGADGAPFNFTVEDVTANPSQPSSNQEKSKKDNKKDDPSN